MPTKSKITSYITSHRSSSASAKADNATTYEWFDPKLKDEVYNPDPERMIGTVLTRLMSYPGQTLPREYNGFLLHVIESYRVVKHDLRQAKASLDAEIEEHETITTEFGRVGRSWAAERNKLIAEFKRQESLIAEGRKELTALLGARQASIGPTVTPTKAPMQKAKEVAQEMLPKGVAREDMSGSLRSERRISQSHDMTALSRTLEADGHSAELPYGTPPSRDSRSGLAGVHDSPLRGGKSKPASRRTTPSKNSIKDWSDEDMSSSGGDRLPDETNSAKESLNAANDMDFLLQVTKWLADRRDVDPTEIFPEVAELLLGKEDGKTLPDTPQSIRVRQEKPLPSLPGSVEEGEIKSTLRPFVPKRRLTEGELLANHSTTAMPRAIEKISPTDVRRFSFMPGDDTAPTALTHWSVEDRVTKRRPDLKAIHSRSLADISSAFHPLLQNAISPRSPKSRPSSVDTATATTTQSKIPSPTTEYSTGSPRRDDSGSNRSVVTVIRDSSGRSINTSNPNSPSSVTGSDSFVDPIKRLRSDPAAVAASRAAADSRGSTMKTTKDGKAGPSRKSSATGSENRTTSTKAQIDHGCAGGESRAENVRRGNAISPDFETKAAKGITSGGLRT